jgi:hypothetical protein
MKRAESFWFVFATYWKRTTAFSEIKQRNFGLVDLTSAPLRFSRHQFRSLYNSVLLVKNGFIVYIFSSFARSFLVNLNYLLCKTALLVTFIWIQLLVGIDEHLEVAVKITTYPSNEWGEDARLPQVEAESHVGCIRECTSHVPF